MVLTLTLTLTLPLPLTLTLSRAPPAVGHHGLDVGVARPPPQLELDLARVGVQDGRVTGPRGAQADRNLVGGRVGVRVRVRVRVWVVEDGGSAGLDGRELTGTFLPP